MTEPEKPVENSRTELIGAPELLHVSRMAMEDVQWPGALTASIFAAVGAEAWINHLIWLLLNDWQRRDLPEIGRLRQLAAVFDLTGRDAHTRTKFDAVGLALRDRPWDWGQAPFQHYGVVMQIRNKLVHHKPESTMVEIFEKPGGDLVVLQEQHDSLSEQIFRLGVVTKPAPSQITSLLSVLARQEVGVWSYHVVCRVIGAVVQAIPEAHREYFGADVATQLADAAQ